MKIAMPYSEGNVNPHFGSSREFIVFDTQDDKITNSKILTNETLHNHSSLAQMLKSEGSAGLWRMRSRKSASR